MPKMYVEFGVVATTPEEVIRRLAHTLYVGGCVTEQYADAAVERESLYPTGLPIPHFGLAIPHAGPQYVFREAYAVGRLHRAVDFVQMGDVNQKVAVELAVLIAIPNPDQQLPAISRLISIFSDEKLVTLIRACSSKAELQKLLEHHLFN
jgi:PTS system galactitol-specific IIA component